MSQVIELGQALFEMGYNVRYIRQYCERWGVIFMHNCEVCGKPDDEKPMAFRMKPWCSENHRKKIQGNEPVKKY